MDKSLTFCEMHKPSGCGECPNRRVCKNSTVAKYINKYGEPVKNGTYKVTGIMNVKFLGVWTMVNIVEPNRVVKGFQTTDDIKEFLKNYEYSVEDYTAHIVIEKFIGG